MNDNIAKKNTRLNKVSMPAEIIMHFILILFCLFCIVPFIFVIIISFTAEESIRQIGFSFIPNKLSLQSYYYAFAMGGQLWQSYFNSFFVTIVGTALSVFICILYSYALFRKDFKYRRFFTFFSFFTMLFGGGLIPTIVVMRQLLGLYDNYAALIVPLLVNPFNFIVMRTFFQSTVPTEIIESAQIDGSGEYGTLFKIIIPISKPGIATIALLNAIAYWNEWFIPMVLLAPNSKGLFTLQYMLYRMQAQVDFLARNAGNLGAEAATLIQNMPQQSLRMTLVVFVVLPIACAYPFFQQFIISGLTIGSVKE